MRSSRLNFINPKGILFLFIGVLILFSCKKDELDGNRAMLIGEWKWVSTEYIIYDWWSGNDTMNLTPTTEGIDHYLQFREEGELIFKNDNEDWKKRIVFAKYTPSEYHPGYNYFGIFLNNKHNYVFQGVVSPDTIILYHSPHVNYEVADTSTSISYFVRN